MKILEIIESIKNKARYKILDTLAGIQELAKQIRQNYNKFNKNKHKLVTDKKRVLLHYAQYVSSNKLVQNNPSLMEMLNEMIDTCKK